MRGFKNNLVLKGLGYGNIFDLTISDSLEWKLLQCFLNKCHGNERQRVLQFLIATFTCAHFVFMFFHCYPREHGELRK